MSAPVASGPRVFHWKHGWIPLDHFAATPPSMKAEQKAHKPFKALPVREYDTLSPVLREKIGKKLTALTGLPEPVLAQKVQDNLTRMYANGLPADRQWYPNEGADIEKRAKAISDQYGVDLTKEQLVGMVAVTSAHKRWVQNKDFAEEIARKLAADDQFEVTPEMISDYNAWSGKRRGDVAVPHPDLTPGTYRPSQLPSDFVASKTPGMPRHINQDYVIRAVQIYHGEKTLDEVVQGPKQRSFVNNLMDPENPHFVTNDTWHYRAAMAGIPVTGSIGPKGKQLSFNYTLEQWTDLDLTVADGRAALYGYDPAKGRYHADNVDATGKAIKNPQEFFQSGPSAKAEDWRGSWGTYPWFTKQTQAMSEKLGIVPSSVQAVAWGAVGGGEA